MKYKKVQFTGGLILEHLYVVVCSLFYHDYALACFFSIFKFNFFLLAIQCTEH